MTQFKNKLLSTANLNKEINSVIANFRDILTIDATRQVLASINYTTR